MGGEISDLHRDVGFPEGTEKSMFHENTNFADFSFPAQETSLN